MNKNNPAKPFAFLMEASMLGVGVGFDDKGADKDFTIYKPTGAPLALLFQIHVKVGLSPLQCYLTRI
jgi:hypothetical protein